MSYLVPLFQNESKCENEFYIQFQFHANQSHFHKNGFALRLPLKQGHKGTRTWPVYLVQNLMNGVLRLDIPSISNSSERYGYFNWNKQFTSFSDTSQQFDDVRMWFELFHCVKFSQQISPVWFRRINCERKVFWISQKVYTIAAFHSCNKHSPCYPMWRFLISHLNVNVASQHLLYILLLTLQQQWQ